MEIREETQADAEMIRDLTQAAFAGMEHASGSEADIPGALRAAGALSLSLVAVEGAEMLGHVAFSPVTIGAQGCGWYGLGPVSVRPDQQRRGIGAALIRAGLAQMREAGARGCVVLGDPAYYQRFGFACDPMLRFEGVPPEYFMRLVLDETAPQVQGDVVYHPAFY